MLKPLCYLLTLLILQDRFPLGQFLGLPKAGQPPKLSGTESARGSALILRGNWNWSWKVVFFTKGANLLELLALSPPCQLSFCYSVWETWWSGKKPAQDWNTSQKSSPRGSTLTDLRVTVQSFASWWSQSNLSFCCWSKLGIFLSE